MNRVDEVIVVIGAGGIGVAVARRQSFGRTVLLADYNEKTLNNAAHLMQQAGYTVETQVVDVASRKSVQELVRVAKALGSVTQVINTAGLSPNMASIEDILRVDLYGAAVVFEEFGKIIAAGGSALIISSMAGHMLPVLPPEQEQALIHTPSEELLGLPFLQAGVIENSGVAYMLAKRANHLHVQASAMTWSKHGARVNSISPGIIVTPLAQHELNSATGDMYRALVSMSATKRMASPDEVANVASFLLSTDAAFITGSDLLIDGGVIAAMKTARNQVSQQ